MIIYEGKLKKGYMLRVEAVSARTPEGSWIDAWTNKCVEGGKR